MSAAPHGAPCRDGGCLDRNACPYGTEYRYPAGRAGVPHGGVRALIEAGRVFRALSRRCVRPSTCRLRCASPPIRCRRIRSRARSSHHETRHRNPHRRRRGQGRAFPGGAAARRKPASSSTWTRSAQGRRSTRWPNVWLGEGYAVLVPDLFYRNGAYGPFDAKTAFADDKKRAELMALIGGTTQEMTRRDTAAFLDALSANGVDGSDRHRRLLHGRRPRPQRGCRLSRPYRGRRQLPWRQSGERCTRQPARQRFRASRHASMSARPASIAAFRRNSRRGWPRRCGPPRSTTSSRTMSACSMAGPCRTTASMTRPAPNATGSG